MKQLYVLYVFLYSYTLGEKGYVSLANRWTLSLAKLNLISTAVANSRVMTGGHTNTKRKCCQYTSAALLGN